MGEYLLMSVWRRMKLIAKSIHEWYDCFKKISEHFIKIQNMVEHSRMIEENSQEHGLSDQWKASGGEK